MTNEEAVALAKTQFITITERALESALLASPAAIIEAPPWNLVTNEIVDWVANHLANATELEVFFSYINFNVNQQGHDFIQAVYQNQQAQLKGTDDEKKIAIQNLETAFTKLITLSA